jgi:predicted TIM-barrel enzyme
LELTILLSTRITGMHCHAMPGSPALLEHSLNAFIHTALPRAQRVRDCYMHFADKKTEAQVC